MEYESVHPHLFVALNAYCLDQPLLVTYCCQRRHEPTIAIISLSYVIGGRAFDKKLGFIKNILVLLVWCDAAQQQERGVLPQPS
jgi:hypothetical protein